MKRITGAFIEDFGQMVSTLNELIDAFNSHQKEHDRTTKERCDFFDDVFDRISKLENKLAGHEEGIYPDVHSTHTTHKETKAGQNEEH